jgi:hypothetical protein
MHLPSQHGQKRTVAVYIYIHMTNGILSYIYICIDLDLSMEKEDDDNDDDDNFHDDDDDDDKRRGGHLSVTEVPRVALVDAARYSDVREFSFDHEDEEDEDDEPPEIPGMSPMKERLSRNAPIVVRGLCVCVCA